MREKWSKAPINRNQMGWPSQRSPKAVTPAPKLRYVVFMISGIFAILGVQLLLSIQVSGGAYEISSLRAEVRASQQSQQMVSEEISALVAPDTLANLATSMGMVPDNNPAYLRLSNGSVVGNPLPAAANSVRGVHLVTAGTENQDLPAIVEDVFVSITHASDSDYGSNPDITSLLNTDTSAPKIEAERQESATQSSTTRFGGSIPSPVTR